MGFISVNHMNKTHFFLVLLSLALFSCFKKTDKLDRSANTKINSISIIIDDQLWYGEVGDSLRNKFASPVIGLTKEEPLFTINQYSAKLLEGFMTNGRNVIIVKKEDYTKYEVRKNQFANPQNVFRIYGKSIKAILKLLETNAASMVQQIRETEIKACQKANAKSLLNQAIFRNKFHFNLDVPTGFKYVLHKSNLIWLKKEIVGGNVSLLLYQVPLHSFDTQYHISTQIVQMRDSIGEFIQGREINTPMVTDDAYAPYFTSTRIDGKRAFETKGTWELQNDYMMGPFINYTIVDEAYNRILVLEGFCYAPSNDERDLMLNLEGIIKSLKVQTRSEESNESVNMEN